MLYSRLYAVVRLLLEVLIVGGRLNARLLKRQMFGRANLDPLRRRVLAEA